MELRVLFLALCLSAVAAADETNKPKKKIKFLAYSPRMANSHTNFLGKVSDTLVEAGHEVVMLSPILDHTMSSDGTKKARVISLPQTANARYANDVLGATSNLIWTPQDSKFMFYMMQRWDEMIKGWALTCNDTLHYPGLLEQLRAEDFDVGYGEALDFCSFALFHVLGIKKFVVMHSMALIDGHYFLTQAPGVPSYVPTMTGFSDQMTFLQRLGNAFSTATVGLTIGGKLNYFHQVFDAFQPGFPSIEEVAGNASLVFINSEPLQDFPRVTNHRIIDIRGVIVDGKHGKLNQTWSDIMDLRPKTVLLSFGSFAKAHLMPEEFKKTIRNTLKKFPDVTFIWKYEKPEHNISRGIPNIIESTWVPQVDLLYDSRLSAFITHCGAGSTTEATMAGVPLLVIPLGADQIWNARVVDRSGAGRVIFDKMLLAEEGPLEENIRELLNDDKYRIAAKRQAEMLTDRPFKMKDILVRNIEFVAGYGPLRMLDHEGRNLNFFQFYLLDVFAFLGLIVMVVLALIILIVRFILKLVLRVFRIKKKVD